MGIWAQAGKPDFARCAELISRFDPQLRESLSRSEMKVLQWQLYYVWKGSYQANKDLGYCSFSQSTVASKFGRSRWTARRAVVRLGALGLLRSLRRRPTSDGHWNTNLYFLSAKLKAILARILNKVRAGAPCSKSAPQEFRKKTPKLGDSLPGVAAQQNNDPPPEKPTWQPTMRLSELVKHLNPTRFTGKSAVSG